MQIISSAFKSAVPPAFADVPSVELPSNRMAAAVKNCANGTARIPQDEKKHGIFCKAMHALGFKSGDHLSKTTTLDTVDGPSAEAPSSDGIASRLKRTANVSERPIYIERRNNHGALCKVMHALGLKSKEVSTEPLAAEKSAIRKEIEKFNFEGTLKADPKFMNDAMQAMYGAIFGRALDNFGAKCVEYNVSQNEKKECSVELGDIAREFGMDGEENNGVFDPKCKGANGFATMILTPIQKLYNASYNDNRSELTLYTEVIVSSKLRSIALDQRRPDPKDFSQRLQNVLVEQFPDYD